MTIWKIFEKVFTNHLSLNSTYIFLITTYETKKIVDTCSLNKELDVSKDHSIFNELRNFICIKVKYHRNTN